MPHSLLIATDGSGQFGGSWAFAVWGHFKGRWYRLGWEGALLASTPWLPAAAFASMPAGRVSFVSEAAAIWCAAALDRWQMYMGARPRQVTVAVDNASALQVAAGHAAASDCFAQAARVLWQGVQARINTLFCHVHSHVGVMVNTFADALAGFSGCSGLSFSYGNVPYQLPDAVTSEGPFTAFPVAYPEGWLAQRRSCCWSY